VLTILIKCYGDDKYFNDKIQELIKTIMAEMGLRNIAGIIIDSDLKEGYIIISLSLKTTAFSSRLIDCGTTELTAEGALFHLEPSMENRLPLILKTLRTEYGKNDVTEQGRYDILIKKKNIDLIGSLNINELDTNVKSKVITAIEYLAPEGFMISKTLIKGSRFSMLFSEYSLKESWLEKMQEIHRMDMV
jgi:putative methanogenesis marker protein 17